MIKLEPLKREHLSEVPYSVKGFAVVDKEVKGLVYTVRIMGIPFVIFDLKENTFGVKKTLIRGWRRCQQSGEMFAVQDKQKPTSEGLLRHFGFTPYNEDIWVWQPQSLT